MEDNLESNEFKKISMPHAELAVWALMLSYWKELSQRPALFEANISSKACFTM